MDVGPFPTFDGVTGVSNSITRNGHISIITRLEGQLLVPRSNVFVIDVFRQKYNARWVCRTVRDYTTTVTLVQGQ